MPEPVAITGIAAITAMGNTPAQNRAQMEAMQHGLRPLSQLDGMPAELGKVPAGWIEPRSLLAGSHYGPAANLTVELARQAVADAALRPDDLRNAWLFVGTSRGNAAGWLAPWPGRRAHQQMATSNSMHSELAAAVSIMLGLRGPYHVLSNGCASGLDAIGFGYWAVSSRLAQRALVVSADLPLVPVLLRSYAQTGLLSHNAVNDPYSPETTGFLPAEGGAALVLEPVPSAARVYGYLQGYWANSDAYHPLGLPADGAGIADCLRLALAAVGADNVTAVCPHASGTRAHGQAERCALRAVLGVAGREVSLHLLKPFTGHAIGASGAIDVALLAQFLRDGLLPPNLPHLTGAGAPFTVPGAPLPFHDRVILKISVGMGGHNAVVALSREEHVTCDGE